MFLIALEIEAALGLSEDEFTSKYGRDKPAVTDTNIVFHCGLGIRSIKAVTMARELGYNL